MPLSSRTVVALNQSIYSSATQFQRQRDLTKTEDKRLVSMHIFYDFNIFGVNNSFLGLQNYRSTNGYYTP
jgi:hypothetical protein